MASRDAVVLRSVYRGFVREARKLSNTKSTVRLSPPLVLSTLPQQYGRGRVLTVGGGSSTSTATTTTTTTTGRTSTGKIPPPKVHRDTVIPQPAEIQSLLFGSNLPFKDAGFANRVEFSGKDVLRIVRQAFRQPTVGIVASSSSSAGHLHQQQTQPPQRASSFSSHLDVALSALSTLTTQISSQPSRTRTLTSFSHASTTTNNKAEDISTKDTSSSISSSSGDGSAVSVAVEISTAALPGLPPEIMKESQTFPFTYRVNIENTGTKTIQIISRHWIFQDSSGGVIEVPKGSPGLVGMVPVLQPGDVFSYWSGTQLRTQDGTMKGSFQVLVPSTNERFDALIDTTVLTTKHAGGGSGRNDNIR